MKKIISFLLFVVALVFAHDECVVVKHVSTSTGYDDDIIRMAFDNARAGNKTCVKLTGGNWKIQNYIVIPTSMELRGTYTSKHGYTKAGSTIECNVEYDHTLDSIWLGKQACVMLQGGATITGFNIVWPYGRYSDASWSPFNPYFFNGVNHVYPWTVSCFGSQTVDGLDYPGKCTIRNVTISNARLGINLDFGFDHHLDNVNIGVYEQGMLLDDIASLGIIENVRISDEYLWEYYTKSYLSYDKTRIPWYTDNVLYNFTVGMRLNRVDWGDIRNVYIRKVYKGLIFDINSSATYEVPYQYNTTWWQNPQVFFNGLICDSCNYAIYALSIQKPAGIQIANGNLNGKINVEYSNWGPIHISNSILDYSLPQQDENIPHIAIKSPNCEVSMTNTIIRTGGNLNGNIPFGNVVIQNTGRVSLSNVNMVQLNPSIPYGPVFQHIVTSDADQYHRGSLMWWDGLYSTPTLIYSQVNQSGQPVTGRIHINNVNQGN